MGDAKDAKDQDANFDARRPGRPVMGHFSKDQDAKDAKDQDANFDARRPGRQVNGHFYKDQDAKDQDANFDARRPGRPVNGHVSKDQGAIKMLSTLLSEMGSNLTAKEVEDMDALEQLTCGADGIA